MPLAPNITTTEDLPDAVRDRFPDLRLDDPATWPEPARCTDGAPFGPAGFGTDRADAAAWLRFLSNLREEEQGRKPWNGRCRSRAKVEHLCGTHDNVRRKRVEQDERDRRRQRAAEEALALAHRLAAVGVECDAVGYGVRLSPEQGAALAERLERDGAATWPPTDLSVPPPL